MENTNTKKRKLKCTFLTTSKKCKGYRQRKSNICNATPNISDSSSDTDTDTLSHGGILFSPPPEKGILKKPTFTKTKVHYKSKYVQAKLSIKESKMQTRIIKTKEVLKLNCDQRKTKLPSVVRKTRQSSILC